MRTPNRLQSLEPLEARRLLNAGDIDIAFNGGKLLTSAFSGGGASVSALAVLPDGGILAAGTEYKRIGGISTLTNMVVVKYTFEGNLDTTFGAGGEILATPRGMVYAYQFIQTPDGGFLLAGGKQSVSPLILKFTAAGKVDTSFGKNGVLPIGAIVDIGRIAVDQTGRVLVPGRITNTGMLRRFSPGGKIDTSFATNGDFAVKAPTPAIEPTDFHQVRINSVVLDSQGRTIFSATNSLLRNGLEAGPRLISTTELANRLTDSGQADPSFDMTGLPSLRKSDNNGFSVGKVIANGDIMLVGDTMAQLDPDGHVDTIYGENGISDVKRSGFGKAAIADDGSAVLPLSAVVDTTADFSLRRVLPDGTLDESFGDNGILLLSQSSQPTTLTTAVAIAPDGTIVAGSQAGQLSPSGKVDTRSFAIARVLAEAGPAVQLVPRTLRRSSKYVAFEVLIRSDDPINLATLDNGDLKLLDVDGNTHKARFVSASPLGAATDNRYVRATYRVLAPDGIVWRSADNGNYQVRLQRRQVSDTHGDVAVARILGRVLVRIVT